MGEKKIKRVSAGSYKRYDSAYIRVLIVVPDVDTGKKNVMFVYEDIKHDDGKTYSITLDSFCSDVEYMGKTVPKFTRCTERPRGSYYEEKLIEEGYNLPRKHRKKESLSDYEIRECRKCTTYEDYAKDICVNYKKDLNRYKKTVAEKRWVGVLGAAEFAMLKEDLIFLKDCIGTSLNAYYPIFKKRYIELLSIRKCAEEMEVSKGSIEYQEKKLFIELAALLKHRDEQDGKVRLMK